MKKSLFQSSRKLRLLHTASGGLNRSYVETLKSTISYGNQTLPPSCSTSVQEYPILMLTIPHELVQEILLKLPVKSLLRFQCVSKSWLSLISSAEFIKAHLKLNEKNQRVLYEGYDISRTKGGLYLKHCSLNSLLDGEVDPADAISLYNLFHKVTNCVSVDYWACCNGLIFTVTYDREFFTVTCDTERFLWNPSTRKSKKLPDLGLPSQRVHDYDYHIVYGFGYDESSDDYKVAAVIYDYGYDYKVAAVTVTYSGGKSHSSEIKVYSTKTNSWKRVGEFRGFPPHNSGVFANGNIYWLSNSSSGCSPIIYLDLATETCGEVEKPNHESSYHTKLGIFEGSLSLICNARGVLGLDVWVMKESDVSKSWTKLLRITTNDVDYYYLREALCISSNGQFLGVFDRRLGLYNPNHCSLRHVKGLDDNNILHAACFIESLVSPGV